MSLQDAAYSGVRNFVPELGEFTLNPTLTPHRILFGKPNNEINDHLTDAWSTSLLLSAIGVVPFIGNELSMPTEDCIQREEGANLAQCLSAENLALDRQATMLVIGQNDSILFEFLFEDCVPRA
ncbi:hypothetical protein [Planctomycetes bacterium CA13]